MPFAQQARESPFAAQVLCATGGVMQDHLVGKRLSSIEIGHPRAGEYRDVRRRETAAE